MRLDILTLISSARPVRCQTILQGEEFASNIWFTLRLCKGLAAKYLKACQRNPGGYIVTVIRVNKNDGIGFSFRSSIAHQAGT
jgi:hypothetical protein